MRRRDFTGEPAFELWAGPERRLAMRTAQAHAQTEARQALAHEFRANAVTLTIAPEGVVAVAVGAAVAASFGLVPGVLAGRDDSLSGALMTACASIADAVAPFEAAIESQGACFLLRGVLLPVDSGVEAVLSWKQVLDDDATARLQAELLAARRPVRPPVDAFGA